MWRRLLIMVGAVASLVTASSSSVASAVPDDQLTPAAAAVRLLADPSRSSGGLSLPDDFESIMGYRAAVASGPSTLTIAVRRDGTCSSPFGETRYGFGPPCQAHDLGYDLLRYSARTGAPQPTSARRALDAAFGERLRAVCQDDFRGTDLVGCLAAAATYEAVVSVNSWRQGFAAPAAERPWVVPLWGVLLGGGPMTLLGAAVRSGWRRHRRRG